MLNYPWLQRSWYCTDGCNVVLSAVFKFKFEKLIVYTEFGTWVSKLWSNSQWKMYGINRITDSKSIMSIVRWLMFSSVVGRGGIDTMTETRFINFAGYLIIMNYDASIGEQFHIHAVNIWQKKKIWIINIMWNIKMC